MPVIEQIPATLRPFHFHHLYPDYVPGRKEATTDCPFCGREGKFSVNVETGQWRCLVCATGTAKGGGNSVTFVRALWEHSGYPMEMLEELRQNRGFMSGETITAWGGRVSPLTGDWLIPGYGADGKLNQLYRYIQDEESGKKRLVPTTGLGLQFYHAGKVRDQQHTVWVTEGVWDGMAVWEVLKHCRREGDGLVYTSNEEFSLAQEIAVVAIPGSGAVGEPFKKYLEWFAGKRVVLLFDSDHPRQVQNKGATHVVEPAGLGALKRAAALLSQSEGQPQEIKYLRWGDNGYDPEKPSGYDVRDHLKEGETLVDRVKLLDQLVSKFEPVPSDWIPGQAGGQPGGKPGMELIDCDSWPVLINQWRRAMTWTEGLDRALSVMLAAVTSTKILGEHLWCKILGPASCGKSTLCEAISTNRKYVLPKSTLRGFHSGYRETGSEDEDNSLIVKIRDKTLIVKDGDALLQSPTLAQTLSEARDLYDGTARNYYRNKASKDYSGVRFTFLLCGTDSLRQLDSSELGERFLDCVIMEGIDDDLEMDVLMRCAHRAERCMAFEANGELETHYDPDLVKAMQMTGGYVSYLRENARELLAGVYMSPESLSKCAHLAKFVAYMRARPSLKQVESISREFGSRLTIQLVRLAKTLAAVLGHKETDTEIMRRVTRVAMDTSRGRTLELSRHLAKVGENGHESRTLAQLTNQTEEKERLFLRFLRGIGAVEVFKPTNGGLIRWRLTPTLAKLWTEVMQGG